MKSKTTKTTMDGLALMVGRGFNIVDKRFDTVDKRFDKVDGQLFEIKQRLGRIEKDILEDHRNRIEILESHMRSTQPNFRSFRR